MIKFPYQDLSLENIKGERWRDIPGLEMYCKISSFGRLKRLQYELEYSDGRLYIKPEMIIKPVVMKLPNGFTNDNIYFLRATITLYGQVYNYSLARLVYNCFNKPFDMADESIVILTKNGNGLDIRPVNLKIASHSDKQQRIFNLKRRAALLPGESGKLKAITNSQKVNSKPVTQYNKKGKKIKTYPSVAAATRATGISQSHISNIARGIEFSAGGYCWRYGKKATINMGPMLELVELRRKRKVEKFGKKVTQYAMNGNRLAKYACISDASKATGVTTGEISKVITPGNNRTSAGGFYWKKGYGRAKIIPML